MQLQASPVAVVSQSGRAGSSMTPESGSVLSNGTTDDNQHLSEANCGFNSLTCCRTPNNSERLGMKQEKTEDLQKEKRADVKRKGKLVGRTIRKLFGKKHFKGVVKSFDSVSNWYKIEYEDGDREDLEETEVEDLLVPLEHRSPFSLSFTDENVTPRNQKKRKNIKHDSKENKRVKSNSNVISITEDREMRSLSGITFQEGIKRYLQKLQANGQNPINRRAIRRESETEGFGNISNRVSSKEGTICSKEEHVERQGKCLVGSSFQKKFNTQLRTGTVISYNGRRKLYKVKYEDEKCEDLEWKDLEPNLTSEFQHREKKNNDNENAIKTQGEDAFIGWSLRKTVGRKVLKGTVVSYDPKSHLYKVRFDAGDEHELAWNDLEPMLDAKQQAVMKLQSEMKKSVNNKNFNKRGSDLVGKMTSKKFGKKIYIGTVISYDDESQFYKVEYEDGDQEDLEWDELESTLILESHQGGTSIATVSKRQRTSKKHAVKSQK